MGQLIPASQVTGLPMADLGTRALRYLHIARTISNSNHDHDTPQEYLDCALYDAQSWYLATVIMGGMRPPSMQVAHRAVMQADCLLDRYQVPIKLLQLVGDAANVAYYHHVHLPIPDVISAAIEARP